MEKQKEQQQDSSQSELSTELPFGNIHCITPLIDTESTVRAELVGVKKNMQMANHTISLFKTKLKAATEKINKQSETIAERDAKIEILWGDKITAIGMLGKVTKEKEELEAGNEFILSDHHRQGLIRSALEKEVVELKTKLRDTQKQAICIPAILPARPGPKQKQGHSKRKTNKQYY